MSILPHVGMDADANTIITQLYKTPPPIKENTYLSMIQTADGKVIARPIGGADFGQWTDDTWRYGMGETHTLADGKVGVTPIRETAYVLQEGMALYPYMFVDNLERPPANSVPRFSVAKRFMLYPTYVEDTDPTGSQVDALGAGTSRGEAWSAALADASSGGGITTNFTLTGGCEDGHAPPDIYSAEFTCINETGVIATTDGDLDFPPNVDISLLIEVNTEHHELWDKWDTSMGSFTVDEKTTVLPPASDFEIGKNYYYTDWLGTPIKKGTTVSSMVGEDVATVNAAFNITVHSFLLRMC